ncbi:MAG: DUF4352 domain-containing protein [Acidimicrobiaceae bacterium]|nr:DUF4352 domain-containing protein [Acidimicrobiaceae bacterium]
MSQEPCQAPKHKPLYRGRHVWVALVLGGIISIAATSCSSRTSANSTTTTTARAATVGSTLTLKNRSTVQLFSYGSATPSAFYTAKPDHTVVAVSVQGCVPSSGEETSFNPLYFSIKMSDNTKIDPALGAVDGQIDSSRVSPGDCVRGNVGFAVPSGTKPEALYFQPFGSSALRWTLPSTTTGATPSPTTTSPSGGRVALSSITVAAVGGTCPSSSTMIAGYCVPPDYILVPGTVCPSGTDTRYGFSAQVCQDTTHQYLLRPVPG